MHYTFPLRFADEQGTQFEAIDEVSFNDITYKFITIDGHEDTALHSNIVFWGIDKIITE